MPTAFESHHIVPSRPGLVLSAKDSIVLHCQVLPVYDTHGASLPNANAAPLALSQEVQRHWQKKVWPKRIFEVSEKRNDRPSDSEGTMLSARYDTAGRLSLDRDRVLDEVRPIVAEAVGIASEDIQEELSFIGDYGCDSLDTIAMVMELEEHFDIVIVDEIAVRFKTLGTVADGIMQLLQAQGKPS